MCGTEDFILLIIFAFLGTHTVIPLGGAQLTLSPTDFKHLLARQPLCTQQLLE